MPGPRRVPAAAALLIATLSAAQDEAGVGGRVLTPDGGPAAGGDVTFRSQGAATSAPIDEAGGFRLVPHVPGAHEVHVAVPGFAPYRAIVVVPPSKVMRLPPIRLSPATYFRVRFVTTAGEPVAAPHVMRRSIDVNGAPVWEPPGAQGRDRIDPDGTVTLGPLPRGVTAMAVEAPPLARTRLPDVRVAGGAPLIDGGIVTLGPGALLQVEVVDDGGAPVAGHDVFLEDAAPLSPLWFPPVRTDEAGHARFTRVAAGSYRVHTRTVGPCGRAPLTIARAIAVAGAGTMRTRLVVGGTAVLRLTSFGAPLPATGLSATPESPPAQPPPWLRPRPGSQRFIWRPFGLGIASPCSGFTDGDGRVTFANFPPGPARIDVRLAGSTWVRRISVPAAGRAVSLEIPPGYLPLRVLEATTAEPVAGAEIAWLSGGARVEALSSASGEALLGGVADAPGTLTIRAAGYEPREMKLSGPPAVLHEVGLTPARGTTLTCRVTTASGEPVPAAVVELTPDGALEVPLFAATDEKGVASFVDVPPGPLRLVATADGYDAAGLRLPAGATGDAAIVLASR